MAELAQNLGLPYHPNRCARSTAYEGRELTHRLQLFDTPESLAQSVTQFLFEGYERGENILIAAKRRNLDAILTALEERGCFSQDFDRQRLIALDATELLTHLRRHGVVDALRFEAEIGTLVERLSESGPLRVYGEIVEVLAEEGDFDGAVRLETLWNGLSQRYPFTLMCGYSSAHFTTDTSALRRICETHNHISTTSDDTLGSYLLARA